MTGRERFLRAVNYIQTDHPPIDLGATAITGIHASVLEKLVHSLGFKKKIYVYDIFMQLGYVDEDIRKALNVDIVGLLPYTNFIGNINKGELIDYPIPHGGMGKIEKNFQFDIFNDGSRFAYPMGDRTILPSMKMPAGGCFFDNIERSHVTCEDLTDPYEDFKGCFELMTDEEAEFYKKQAEYYYNNTDYAIISNFTVASFGDAALLPGAKERYPKGIRSLQEWYMAHKLLPDYVKAVYNMQLKVALKNLEILKQALGDMIQSIVVSCTDFGMQNSSLISVEDFRKFYKPNYALVNDYIHKNTGWKTFYHSCGSIWGLLDDFVDCGIDILNPIQCSAANMDAANLKNKYGKKLVFWGGGIDTQKVLPFGTEEECRKMARERINILGKDGGFIFNPVHNIQCGTPINNILAIYKEANRIL